MFAFFFNKDYDTSFLYLFLPFEIFFLSKMSSNYYEIYRILIKVYCKLQSYNSLINCSRHQYCIWPSAAISINTWNTKFYVSFLMTNVDLMIFFFKHLDNVWFVHILFLLTDLSFLKISSVFLFLNELNSF